MSRPSFLAPLMRFAAGLRFPQLFLLTAAFGPLFSPYNPYAQDLYNVLSKPSWTHPLGTDSLGRDTLSRLIYGARITLALYSLMAPMTPKSMSAEKWPLDKSE